MIIRIKKEIDNHNKIDISITTDDLVSQLNYKQLELLNKKFNNRQKEHIKKIFRFKKVIVNDSLFMGC
jgi:hypothetical protein